MTQTTCSAQSQPNRRYQNSLVTVPDAWCLKHNRRLIVLDTAEVITSFCEDCCVEAENQCVDRA
jgi:hypothetical protein